MRRVGVTSKRMRVRRTQARPPTLVRSLMRTPVLAGRPEDSLAATATRMVERQVGAVLVMDGPRLVGILTERDLMHAMAEGVDPTTTALATRMTTEPLTVGPDDEARQAAVLMVDHSVRHLPVVEGGTVAGLISARDLLGLGEAQRRLLSLACEPW